MRFSIAAVTLLGVAASASADSFFRRQDTFPACANSCTTTADFGSCQITDYHCLCTSQPFVASVTKCITTYCSGDDLQKALTLSQRLCAAVGVTLTSSSPSSTQTSTSTSPSSTSKSGASSTNRNALFGLAIAALAAFPLL